MGKFNFLVYTFLNNYVIIDRGDVLSILIAIDAGHGMTTPGKRTPFFPNSKRFMHENEFNSDVAQKLKVNLNRCGIDTVMVAPTYDDTPLSTRTARANSAGANLYVSIHANALNGVWGSQQGIEVYHYPTSKNGLKAATAIHRHMIQGTTQKDRGIKTAKFYVLKYTNMPAVLVECGFMDNLREATLLLSDDFRQECANDICKGICEYFNIKYVEQLSLYEQALDILYEKYNIDKSYWITRKNIDPLFSELMINIVMHILDKEVV